MTGQLVPGGKREDPISWRQEIGCSGKGIDEPFWDWRQKKNEETEWLWKASIPGDTPLSSPFS